MLVQFLGETVALRLCSRVLVLTPMETTLYSLVLIVMWSWMIGR